MRLHAFLVAALFAVTGCSSGTPTNFVSPPAAATASVVPCSQITELRDLGKSLSTVTNAKTGDTMEYTIVGDGAVSNDVLVMFPGTGQIMTGWPLQMLTNSTYSPKIKDSISYDALEDGPVSLCHDYRIALFDYPGVGETKITGSVTRDMISSDVDAMLNDAATRYQIPTNVVDPVGWSLGTTNALKYAMLSPASNPSRKIHNVILISAGAGGSLQGQVGNNSAPCILSMLDAAVTATGSLENQLKLDASELIFPYIGQTQAQNGTNSGCTATVSGGTLSLSVTPDCGVLNHCIAYLAGSIVDMNTYPWSITKGIDDTNYTQERELSNDFDVASCSGAGPNFTSTGCTAYATIKMSVLNGGLCKTDTSNPDAPVASSCAPLTMTGKITALDGYEDVFTQYTYDQALIAAYGPLGRAASIYPGAAGHGLMIQHPLWTQTEMHAAMQ